MASIVETLNRNIIPLWRSYSQTASAGELAYNGNKVLPLRFDRFNDFLALWQSKHTVISAADLINAAIISDNNTLPEVLKAAEFLCQNSNECSYLALEIARALLEKPVITKDTSIVIEKSFDAKAISLIEILDKQERETKARIGLLKKQLRDFQYNAITYCELSRCYSDLGILDKAEQYMLCAVQLAPHNRYVSRCAARFFVHNGKFSKARKILISNGMINSDPWLLASEIAVSTSMNRSSRLIKLGRQLALSGNVSPFSSSELCFAICKEDLISGSRKDVQLMFNKGMIDPNDNCLAQAEFFTKEYSKMYFDYDAYNRITKKNEADTRNFYNLGKYEDAFLSSVKWMTDFRFSHEPIHFAFDIACTYLKKYDFSISVIKHWLLYNPHDYVMLNNIVYALCLSDKISEAEEYLSKIDLDKQLVDKVENGICLLATAGLLEYRKGNIQNGRNLYQLSIDTAKKHRKKELADKARLNMIREEVHCVDEFDTSLLNEMKTLSTGNKTESDQLKKDILEEVEKRKYNNL